MATPPISVQFFYASHYPGPDAIDVNIADQFQQIRILFTNDGLVAILEKMAGSLIAQVKTHCVSR
jgi:hypothetical protein